jgi:hypothetical protein
MHKIKQSYTRTFDPLLLSQQESPSVGLITKKNTSCYSHTTYILYLHFCMGWVKYSFCPQKQPCMCRCILRQNPIQRIQHSWRLIIPRATAPTLKELLLKTCPLMQACQWDDSSSKKFMSHLEIRLGQDIVLLGISLPFGSSSLP